MYQNAHETYLEEQVASARPVVLVSLLYGAAIDAVRVARQHLAEGDIAARSRAISKTCEILTELTASLDHNAGGDISRRLAELYDYMQRRLLDANFRQIDEPLAEVLGLLSTLGEAWDEIASAPAAAEPVAPQPSDSFWNPPVLEENAMESAHAWSF